MSPRVNPRSGILADQSGTVVILFALLLIPIAGLMAGALDFGRQMAVKQQLQESLDSAALAVARHVHANATGNPEQLATVMEEAKAVGKQMFLANFTPTAGVGPPEPRFSFVGDRVQATGDVNFPASFLGILGISRLDAAGLAEAVIPGRMAAEIVLVLDYSRSMLRNDKYKRMAEAATSFIQRVKTSATGETKFGIVPFSEYVYVTMKGANIRRVTPPFQIYDLSVCITNRDYPYSVTNETPLFTVQASRWEGIGVEEAIAALGAQVNEAAGQNEGGGRTHQRGDNTRNSSSHTDTHLTEEALQVDCREYTDRQVVVRDLTSDFDGLIAAIRAMSPIGLTNIALAAEIGWHVLTAHEPYTSASHGRDDIRKVMILLTDGVQTVETTGPSGRVSISSANDSIAEVCSNMGRAGVVVFTIAYDLRDEFTENLLLNCASDAEYFFDSQASENLSNVFDKIYEQLTETIRLAR
jgi:Flp pilus assembly protein TadG